MMSFNNEVIRLSQELQAYETSAQSYLFGINPQRKMQIFILKRILILADQELLSPERTCIMIFALMNSIKEAPRLFGFGSKLKTIAQGFLDRLQIRESLIKQTTAQQSASAPKVTLIEGMPEGHNGTAGVNFLSNLTLVTDTAADNRDMINEAREIARHYSDTDDLQLAIDPRMENISDILLTRFTSLPLALVGEHLRYLYKIILDQISASLPPNPTKAAKTILLELLPTDLQSDFQKFMDDETFITPKEFRLYATSAHEFANTYVEEKLSAPNSRGRALDAIEQKWTSQRKINNLIKCAFMLVTQFSSLDKTLWLADKSFTSFESLMSYVMALLIILELSDYDELSNNRLSIIERYEALRENTIKLTAEFLKTLHGYELGDLPNPCNLFSLLNAFIKSPTSQSKTQVIRALNAVDPANLQSLAQRINDHIANAITLKDEAKLLMNDSLAAIAQEQSEAYAQKHSLKIINQALQNRLSSFLITYLEELAINEAIVLLPKISKGIQNGTIPIEKHEDVRLTSEAKALKNAISSIVNALNIKLKGCANITIQNKSGGMIYRAKADCQSLTATFEPLDFDIKVEPTFDIKCS